MENYREMLIADRYRIEKKIASGGMADIYLGEDIKLKEMLQSKYYLLIMLTIRTLLPGSGVKPRSLQS